MVLGNIMSSILKRAYTLYRLTQPMVFIPGENDIHLVSYPRSGNTWLRVLVAELLYKESGNNLKDIEFYIPDIHLAPLNKDVIKAEFHVVKSHFPLVHSPEMSQYRKVIYVVRDPRDIVISYFRYLKARGYGYEFDQFFSDWLDGRIWPASWREHVNSWTGEGVKKLNIDIHIVRYEDLLENPLDQVKKIVHFAGWEFECGDIQRAVDMASVENMRKKEHSGLRENEAVAGMKFIGDATSNQWKHKIDPEKIRLMENYCNPEMRRFGYL